MAFKDPGTGGDKLPLDELEGCLLLVDVHEHDGEFETTFGRTGMVRADVAVLDGPRKGHRFDDTLIFPKVLQSQLRGSVGEQVLGRLGKGKAKPGQSAPWQLAAADDADKATAERYATHYATTAAAKAVTDEEPF
jgi:hypothetical protein